MFSIRRKAALVLDACHSADVIIKKPKEGVDQKRESLCRKRGWGRICSMALQVREEERRRRRTSFEEWRG